MNYSFELNSPAIGRIQPFEYSYATTNEYIFTYGRDIYSDLSKFNAPIFAARKRRSCFYYKKQYRFADRINQFNTRIDNTFKEEIDLFRNIICFDNDLSVQNNIRHDFFMQDDSLFANKYILASYFKELLIRQHEKELSVFDVLLGKKDIKKVIVNETNFLNKSFSLEVFDEIFLDLPDFKASYFNKDYIANKDIKIGNIYKNVIITKPDNILTVFDTFLVDTPINSLSVFKTMLTSKQDNEAFIKNSFVIHNSNRNPKGNVYKQILVSKPDILKANIFEEYMSRRDDRLCYVFNNPILANGRDRSNITVNSPILFTKELNVAEIYYNYYELHGFTDSKNITLYALYKDSFSFKDNKKNTFKSQDNLFMNSVIVGTYLSKDNYILFSDNSNLFIKDTRKLLGLDSSSSIINTTESFLNSENSTFRINTTEVFLKLAKKFSSKNNTESFLFSAKENFTINKTNITLSSDKEYAMKIDTTKSLFHASKESFLNKENLFKSGSPVDVFYLKDDNVPLAKDKHNSRINNTELFLHLDSKNIRTNKTIEFLGLAEKPLKFIKATEQFLNLRENYLMLNNNQRFLDLAKKPLTKHDTSRFAKLNSIPTVLNTIGKFSWLSKSNKSIVLNESAIEFAFKSPIDMLLFKNNKVLSKSKHKIMIKDFIAITNKPYYNLSDIEQPKWLSKEMYKITMEHYWEMLEKEFINVKVIDKSINLTGASFYDLHINKNMHLTKERNGIPYLQKEIFIDKDRYRMSILENKYSFTKNKQSFTVDNTNIFLGSVKKFSIYNTDKNLDIIKKGFAVTNNIIAIDKARLGVDVNEFNGTIQQTRKGVTVNDCAESIYKTRHSLSIKVTELLDTGIIRKILPTNILTHYNTLGFIVPARDVYLDNNDCFVYSGNRGYTQDVNIFLEKDMMRTRNMLTDFFVITEEKKAFIDFYHGHLLTKKIRDVMRKSYSSIAIEKLLKNGIIYDNDIITTRDIYKCSFITNDIRVVKLKDMNKNDNDIFITKKNKKAYIHTDIIYADKIFYMASTPEDIWIEKVMRISSQTDNLWIKKTEKDFTYNIGEYSASKIYEAYVSNDEVFINKASYDTIKSDTFTEIIKEPIETTKFKDIQAKKEMINTGISEYIFVPRERYEIEFHIHELKQMEKIIKELEKPVEKTYNWAYVYQYEDPIDPNYEYYGLDELLLPEKDVDYSSFEDIIFDKKNMMPKKPIKIIDDNTFIAKYPIKHPTPDYEKVGIEYVDVPTELMYTLFMKFYQIWYANIFKFGNMSMVDSLKLMLEFMYSHIVTFYGGSPYLEPALRVFRLIRWFGETSVMHNAQYKITCEYEDLKSNLQTGICMIDNELSGFFVNNNLKVLAIEPTSIGQEAYIKLYAPNRKDGKISFSVSFTNGNLEVYVNGDLIDIIYSNQAYISYELPATTTTNEIILKRTASANFGQCYIGNIIIENGSYKNLNIEYDPDLKAGNMPLNDIVNKMVLLANMYDNEQEVFEQYRKGNLAISELYKKLENYWELHHANKFKGKRLTIKET